MTVMEALQWANDKLKEEKVGDSPMLDAQVLLSAILDVPKSWLFTHLDHTLQSHEEEQFQKSIKRRLTHEPVAYIIGWREFYKRPLQVNRFVLIPRPATEVLVDAAIDIAREQDPETTLFADIGTGSGAIAITLAGETGLPVVAVDISKEATAVAARNASIHKLSELVDIQRGELIDPLVSLFQQIKQEDKPLPIRTLILCANLPYLTHDQWEHTKPEVKDHEPKLALVGGKDGLEAYWNLCRELREYRKIFPRYITLLLEIDPDQTQRALALVTHDFPSANPRVLKDLEGHDRVVIADI